MRQSKPKHVEDHTFPQLTRQEMESALGFTHTETVRGDAPAGKPGIVFIDDRTLPPSRKNDTARPAIPFTKPAGFVAAR